MAVPGEARGGGGGGGGGQMQNCGRHTCKTSLREDNKTVEEAEVASDSEDTFFTPHIPHMGDSSVLYTHNV